MNVLRTLSLSEASRRAGRRLLCAAWLTMVAGNGYADEVAAQALLKPPAQLAAGQDRNPKIAAFGSRSAILPASWTTSDLVPLAWQQHDAVVLHRAGDWFTDDRYVAAASDFDASNLFRTRKEQKYRDTLRLLLTKRQVRVWLRDDLHLQCEVKRYRSMDDGRELGLKLGFYYRFE